MSQNPKPYAFYPIRSSSDEDEPAAYRPGELFQRYSKRKSGKKTASQEIVTTTTTATTTTTTTATTSDTTSATTTTAVAAATTVAAATPNPATPSAATTTAATPFRRSAYLIPTDEPWCRCGNCGEMPQGVEQKCCYNECFELTNFQDAEFIPGQNCVLESDLLLNGILRKCVVQTAWMGQRRRMGYLGDDLLFTHMTNANYRYHAYRQYIDFIWGYLGRHNRRVIPACVVTHIRSTWPSADGNYTGYSEVNYGDDDDQGPAYVPADELEAMLHGTEI